jgi:pimeloyl-ACP methyl ester carboxylesterase
MSGDEALAYHHVYDEPESDAVVLAWPRTIPLREGDRGYADMAAIERRLPELREVPALLFWGRQDSVFGERYANRLKELLPLAEGPIAIDGADHFMQDDSGPEIARAIVEFLDRRVGAAP